MQPLIGTESTALAALAYGDNQPFSMFKHTTQRSTSVAATRHPKTANAATPSPVVESPVDESPVVESPVVEGPTALPTPIDQADARARIKALQAEAKHLREQVKAAMPAKVAKPTKTLADVHAEQGSQFSNGDLRWLASHVVAREKAGQEREAAIAAVMEQHADAVKSILTLRDATNTSVEKAVAAWTEANAPATRVLPRKAKPAVEAEADSGK